MKIAFFECDENERKYFKENLKINGSVLKFFDDEISTVYVDKFKDFEIIVIFIKSEIDEEIIYRLESLKYIATMSTGFDHIDLKACKKRKIKVSNVPSYGENTVAEHVFGLILSLSKKIPEGVERTKRDDFSLDGLEGIDLKGKTLGVVGVGNIGENVVRIGKGFQMNVIAVKRKRDMRLAKRLGFKYVSLPELLRNSDIVSINVPLTKETKYLINMKNIKSMKKGSYLINTSRGEVVDNTALLYGLDHEILAGAGLDVLEGECDIKEERELLKRNFEKDCDVRILIENHKLLKERNVIVTPHSASFTKEANQRIIDTTIKNIKGYIERKVKNRVV